MRRFSTDSNINDNNMSCGRKTLYAGMVISLLFVVILPLCHTSVIRSSSSEQLSALTSKSSTPSSSSSSSVAAASTYTTTKSITSRTTTEQRISSSSSTSKPTLTSITKSKSSASTSRSTLSSERPDEPDKPMSVYSPPTSRKFLLHLSQRQRHEPPKASRSEGDKGHLIAKSASTSTSTTMKEVKNEEDGDENIENTDGQGVDVGKLELAVQPVTRAGRCSCPSKSFTQRFKEAYGAVRCVMVGSTVISGARTLTEFVEYDFRSQMRYDGPPELLGRNRRFKVRAFTNADFCGLRFVRHMPYLLYLNDPRRNSIGGNTGKTTFYVDQCSQVYVFHGLTNYQRTFLSRNRN